jgi:hypothetical protein
LLKALNDKQIKNLFNICLSPKVRVPNYGHSFKFAMHTNMINKEIAQKLINETKVLSSQLYNLIQYRRTIIKTE